MSADDHDCNFPRIELAACVRMFGVCCSYDLQRLIVLLSAVLATSGELEIEPRTMENGDVLNYLSGKGTA